MINIEVYSTHAVIRSQQPLTVGLTGAQVHFAFGEPWTDLTKTAVFRQGEKTVTVVDIGRQVEIPWEVLTLPGVPVMIGIYGTDAQEKLVIPTLWAETEPVRPGADPDQGVSPAEPTPSVWAQLQGHMGSLEQLQTNDKTSLAAAINEANRAVCLVKVSKEEDGTYAIDTNIPALLNAYSDGKTLICDFSGALMHLTSYSSTGLFEFTSIKNNTKLCVTILPDGTVTYTNTVLATNQSKLPNPKKLTFIGNATAEYDGSEEMIVGIPSKVSQLQNDRDFLTKETAPVTSVNGQTGAVTVDIPTKVSQLENDSGFLTEETAPVTSVNGQTGAVTVDIPTKVSQLQNDSGFLTEVPVTTTKVSLTEQPDGSYLSSLTAAEIMADYKANKTVHCYHDKMILPLIHSVITGTVFSGIYDGQIYTVTVDSNKVATVTTAPVSSGGADGLFLDKETGMLYLMNKGQIMGGGIQLPTAEGGPTNHAVLTLENTTGWSNKTMQLDSACRISLKWSSVEGGVSTGPGTVLVKVGGIVQYSAVIDQGERELNIRDHLVLGYNLVHVSVTDFYGNSKTITFGVTMFDPAALKSTKLVERTLTGDYTNDRVTTVGYQALSNLTLNKLVLPNATEFAQRPFLNLTADEVDLASAPALTKQMLRHCNATVVKLPSVVSITHKEAFNECNITRIIFNSLENFDLLPGGYATHIQSYDCHKLKTLNAIPGYGATSFIIRTPEVCTLQNPPDSIGYTKIYVPETLVNSYKSATNWIEIADYIFAIEDHPEICGGE